MILLPRIVTILWESGKFVAKLIQISKLFTVTVLHSSTICQNDAEKKLRHLQIWERFFENAAKMSDNVETSSDTNNNLKNRLKMSLLRNKLS